MGVKIRGAVVKGYLAFIKRKWGIQGLEDAKSEVGLTGEISEGNWYPIETACALVDWVGKHHGERYIVEMGREMPKNIGGELKFVFAALIGFDRLLKRLQRDIPSMMFKGAEVVVTRNGKKNVDIELKHVRVSDNSCLLWKGALEGMLAATRTKGSVKQLPTDEDSCKFNVTW
ncbi:MAG: DUF2378 family protein [Euryarchaeota archaeon]|nr:DUF2378 family protein [Euryarchaeota archaeon]